MDGIHALPTENEIIMKRIIATLAVACALSIGAMPAFADDTIPPTDPTTEVIQTDPTVDPAPEPEAEPEQSARVAAPQAAVVAPVTVTASWLQPAGGTPANRSWPQTPYLTDVCGTGWIQTDTYDVSTPAKQAIFDALDDDGLLTLVNGSPEDSAIYVSHVDTQQTACPPLTVASCPAYTTTAITDLAALDLTSSSTDGSSTTTLTADGIAVATAATGHRKAAGYILGTGWQSFATLGDFVLDWTGTSPAPGGQLVVDLDGNGTADGTLVIESLYGGINWLSIPAGGTWVPIVGAPHTAGGGGYPNQGTNDEWLNAYPNMKWTLPGYSLGSGVTGAGTIASITAGCVVYTFGLPAAVVPPVTAQLPTVPVLAATGADLRLAPLAAVLLMLGAAAVAWTRRRSQSV